MFFEEAVQRAHPSWHEILRLGLSSVELQTPGYLVALKKSVFLPQAEKIFAAFSQPIERVSFVLIGEGPYPRVESANGYCFMDAAVISLWSNEPGGGLSKQVNRATSLRNFIKMLLVAEERIQIENLGRDTIAAFASYAKAHPQTIIQTMEQLQGNFLKAGFLLLNATPVFRDDVAPLIDAKAWSPFLKHVLQGLAQRAPRYSHPTVILWGKIADRLQEIDVLQDGVSLTVSKAEHPYNLSFIENTNMHALFAPLALLSR